MWSTSGVGLINVDTFSWLTEAAMQEVAVLIHGDGASS